MAEGGTAGPDPAPPLRPLLQAPGPSRILLWKHFRTDSPRELARRTVEFYRDYRLSAAKLMPDIPILFDDFSLSSWSQIAHLRRFGPIASVGRAPEYVRAVELTRAQLRPQDFLLVTIFSPLALVGVWCGPEALREMAAASRPVAHAVLGALAGVVEELTLACVRAGADGIYYSCWGQEVLSREEYLELGRPYDLAGLRGGADAEARLLHLHGALNGSAAGYADYPVEAVGWSEDESALGLVEGAAELPGKLIMGGISERSLAPAGPGERAHVAELVRALGPRLIVAPGCSLPDPIGGPALESLRALVGG